LGDSVFKNCRVSSFNLTATMPSFVTNTFESSKDILQNVTHGYSTEQCYLCTRPSDPVHVHSGQWTVHPYWVYEFGYQCGDSVHDGRWFTRNDHVQYIQI
jgi:hypothetical protein